jgi:hypothetical protein
MANTFLSEGAGFSNLAPRLAASHALNPLFFQPYAALF